MNGAIAAYKRAMELDPRAADIPAELAELYMRENRGSEAIAAAEQAFKIDRPPTAKRNRVLGNVYAAMAGRDAATARGRAGPLQQEYVAKAIQHLEKAIDADRLADPNVRATLARVCTCRRVNTTKPSRF